MKRENKIRALGRLIVSEIVYAELATMKIIRTKAHNAALSEAKGERPELSCGGR